ncbi:MAG: hypothetical protein IIX86_05355 [Clostridia bacterium]|nr:hypothetical protein [Clostridia bacterium]
METKELIAKLEEYIELGHKFKTYELLKAAVRKIAYLEAECERLKKNYDGLIADAAKAGPDTCRICKHNNSHDDDCKCRSCTEGSCWEWRGEA